MSIGKRIRRLREDAQLSQMELGKALGVSDKAISAWEHEVRTPKMGAIQKMADYFCVAKSYIIDGEGEPPAPGLGLLPPTKHLPRLGAIACGTPILAEQNVLGYDSVPEWVNADFTLICKGDSMAGARINDGDVVCIKAQPEVEPGQIAAVLIGEEATLKRVRPLPGGGVALWPENPRYEPLVYAGADADKVRILGLATHFISKVI